MGTKKESKNSLLIIDDETANIKFLIHVLGREYAIHAATSGATGIKIAMEYMPDLILLDILMPEMDGYQTLSAIKKSEKTREIPVIFITGLTREDDEAKGLALEAADYITKPFNAAVVRLRVRNQIQIINLRRDLEDAVKTAKTANQAKSLFLVHMSHEIRTPMNSILGVTEILMQQKTDPAIEEGLGRIYSSCNVLLGIINDVLDFSKIEAGKLEVIPAQYRLARMIHDSLQLNMMRIADKPIEFELLIDENIPAKLVGDELRIKQIVSNLLSNAFKYTDAGKVIVSVKTECPDLLLSDRVTLVVSVRDTGYGMSKDQVALLFEEYRRFHNKTGKAIEGTGLGLSIVKRLISIMDGEIYVESEVGSGSYFAVRLPQRKVDDEVLGREVAEKLRRFDMNYTMQEIREKIVRDPMPYGSVLIVDDVETNIYVAVGLMKLYRLQIDTASSGQEAIDKVKSGKRYDAIFVDQMMPKMDGMETTKHIRGLGYTAPIIALTANAVAGQAEIFLQNGFDEFISKPIDTRQLDAILNKFIRDKQKDSPCLPASSRLLGKSVNGLDIAKGLERYDGDEQTYLKILRSYITSVRSLLGEIEDVAEDTLADYKIKVHGIKGTSFDFYAEETGARALALEEAAMSGNFTYIKEHNPAFIENTWKLIFELEKMLAGLDAENPKPKKDKPDNEALSRLLAACESYDIDDADAAMDEIKKYQYNSDDGLALWLEDRLDRMDFKQIVEKLGGKEL